jgi:hypothetical protein
LSSFVGTAAAGDVRYLSPKPDKDFEAEVNEYIGYWQHSGRLASAIRIARQNGYVDKISKELLAQGLPPQFFISRCKRATSIPISAVQIPKETYDYVFYILSAAVIGENPRLFGFDFENPLADL